MKQKILGLLNAKFLGKGVRKDGLAQLANSLAITVTTEDEAQALVEKLSEEQVTEFIKEYRKDVDKEVSTSTKTYETGLKQKYDFVEKRADEGKPEKPKDATDADVAAIVAKAVAEAVKPLSEQLNALKGAETAKSRFEKLQDTLKDAPVLFRENTLKNFNRMNFENDEDFEAYVAETSDDLAKYKQETAEEGLRKFGAPNGATKTEPKAKEVRPEVQAYLDAKAGKTDNLGGKEV